MDNLFNKIDSQCLNVSSQIVRRSSLAEKHLVIAKYRVGHKCHTAWIVVSIVVWEGLAQHHADNAYDQLSHNLVRQLISVLT